MQVWCVSISPNRTGRPPGTRTLRVQPLRLSSHHHPSPFRQATGPCDGYLGHRIRHKVTRTDDSRVLGVVGRDSVVLTSDERLWFSSLVILPDGGGWLVTIELRCDRGRWVLVHRSIGES